MREIVLDTETTGLSPKDGHRIIEIGCVELINHLPTGAYYHQYINPKRDVPYASTKITGLTTEFLAPYPFFENIVDAFLDFIGDSTLVIHNASFDMRFLNHELNLCQKTILSNDRVIDTLGMARKKFPGSPANLDALCKRFQIDLKDRTKHGALIDSKLLSHIYLELLGGKQRSLELDMGDTHHVETHQNVENVQFPDRKFHHSKDQIDKHQQHIGTIKNAMWNEYYKNQN